MYKTTVRKRPERQPDRFNVTFKRCTQGYLMTITDISYDRQYKYQLDSLEDAHSKDEKAINKIRKVMAEENLLKTGLNFK
ncbi:hypothetical protein RZO31_13325 [Lactococcus lactis]|uniref:Prophage protein n=1 Tax=Lactococcus lactis TaxID=1358 RepID=A0AAE4T070_9LACT|nr:hypothetical protein [Lactococcus lactis]MDV2633829.1 hypothetical protein [Lactococcus lactis]